MILRRSLLPYLSMLLIVACHGDDNRSPVAETMSVAVVEDTFASWSLRGSDPEGTRVTYRVLGNPSHGAVEVDVNTGAFLYTPEPNFFGIDSFPYSVSDGTNFSQPALVTLHVENINDSPTLAEIPDLQNSAESSNVVYSLAADDVDDDELTFNAGSDDPRIASVEIDSVARTLAISWRDYGETTINVNVSDNHAVAIRSFKFSVLDVTKVRAIRTVAAEAIRLSNATDQAIELRLTHNGFPMFRSDAEIVAFVYAMPDEFAEEPFERKLWRFVRDNVYHAVPLHNDWPFDPWVTVNSLGWGLCGQVSDVYMRVARAAGYTARMWGLTGHVVPEIQIADRWELFDPDLAIYYRNPSGQVAGVEELATEPTLITSPMTPIFDIDVYPYGYSNYVADIYSTSSDNLAASENSRLTGGNYQPLNLPPGATLIYPVRVVEAVEGIDGDLSSPVPHHLQAALVINGEWTGDLIMPWVLWDLSGDGRVAIDDVEFEIGSPLLLDRIRNGSTPVTSVRIVRSGIAMTFVFFVNALRYELAAENTVELTGKDVWAIDVSSTMPPPSQLASWNGALGLRKLSGRR